MNFKRYNESDNSWTDSHYIMGTDTDTITTLPTTIYPNASNITVGIKGQSSQASTPTPSNPVDVNGCGERTGNLCDKTDILSGYEIVNNQIVTNSAWGVSDYIPVEQGKYYIATNTGSPVLEYETIGGTAVRSGTSIVGGNYTPSATTRFIRINFKLVNLDDIMLNSGSIALPFEPFGVKIPISSANTTTPVYLGEVETTRKVKKYECTGDENWRFYSDSTGEYGAWQFYVDNAVNGLALSSALSNIAEYGATAPTRSRYPYGVYLVTSGTGIAFQMAGAKDIFPSVTAWKFYLAQQYANGTPVTVWYVLANEETAVVNEPLRKIGDYADSLTTSIPCTAGENTLDVQTTVQPSEVTAGFSGWHPVTDVHEYENGQWD